MFQKELKIFGAFRTGSNLVRSLLELNYDVLVHNNNFAYKHIPVPADFKNSVFQPFPLDIVSTVKDPFAFLDSTFRYCKKKNFLNIEAGNTFDEFCYQRFVVFDSGFKGFPRYRFSNPVQYWNSINHNLLSLPQEHNHILRYENLLEDMAGEIQKIGDKYGLSRKKGEFVLPTGVTINLSDPERSKPDDYFQKGTFELKNYYLERQYMERFTEEQKDFVYSELDSDVVHALNYPVENSIAESQARKVSFVTDLRQLVKLGQVRIPHLEENLALANTKAQKLAQQLEQSQAIAAELKVEVIEERLANKTAISELENKVLEEKNRHLRDVQDHAENQKNLQNQIENATAEIDKLNQKTQSIKAQYIDVEADRATLDVELAQCNVELKTEKARYADSIAQLASASADISNKEYQVNLARQESGELEKKLRYQGFELEQSKAEIARVKKNHKEMKDSFSFRLGYDLVQAVIKPGKNTLLLPVRIFRNLSTSFAKDKQGDEFEQPVQAATPSAIVEDPNLTVPVAVSKPMALINVACIFDDFTTEGYQSECNLSPVPLVGWLDLFLASKPDLLFVESAWRGNGGQWEYKIGKYAGQTGAELGALIKWCNDNGVPTVFWNKEDPVHFDKFIDSAKQFDVIFTTDGGRIPAYREAAGHNNVHALQFSAQPRLHNPVGTFSFENQVCFAGSYYVNLHKTRAREMNEILDVAKTYGLVIYDRNYARNLEGETEFSFPERFRENVAGTLKYSEMDKAYKGYKYCLNVNSIRDSKTMFSRRVFESLACGTPVLSTWSRGVEETFGKLILMTGNELDSDEILGKLHQSDADYNQMVVQGIREVYSHHLYRHRFIEVLEKSGVGFTHESDYSVTMLSVVSNEREVERAIEQFNNQDFKNKSLLLLLDFYAGLENVLNTENYMSEDITIFHLNSILALGYSMEELVTSSHISFLYPDHYYGKHFLTDLIHAAIYTDAQVIGKAAFFKIENDELHVESAQEYEFVESVSGNASVMDSGLFQTHKLEDIVALIGGTQKIGDFLGYQPKCFSTNRYGFVDSAYTSGSWDPESHSDFVDV